MGSRNASFFSKEYKAYSLVCFEEMCGWKNFEKTLRTSNDKIALMAIDTLNNLFAEEEKI